MHLYNNPSHGSTDKICLNRFPKRLNEQLIVPSSQDMVTGWGIHLIEGMHWPKFYATGCVGFGLSVLFGVLWATLKHDLQGGFSITASIGVMFAFTMGTIQVAILTV